MTSELRPAVVEQIDRDAAENWKSVLYDREYYDPEKEMEKNVAELAADFARHRHQARAEVVGEIERLEKQMAEAYQLAGSIAFDHDISGPDIERLLDLLAAVNLSKD